MFLVTCRCFRSLENTTRFIAFPARDRPFHRFDFIGLLLSSAYLS